MHDYWFELQILLSYFDYLFYGTMLIPDRGF